MSLKTSAHHVLDHAFLLHQLALAGIDSRRQREIAASLALGKIQLLDGLAIVAHQCEILGARLVQADDVARQAAGFGHLIPHDRIVRARFEQAFEGLFGIGGAVLFQQQVDANLVQWIVAGVLRQQAVNPGLCIRQAIVGDVP